MLLSGGSLAIMLRSAGEGIADATARFPSVSITDLRRERPAPAAKSMRPPEPLDEELILRAAHFDAAAAVDARCLP